MKKRPVAYYNEIDTYLRNLIAAGHLLFPW